jgi:polar amino acid transport system substrate-binding protein
LTAYSAEWPPYAFMKDGDVVGITTDLLRAACKEAKLDCAFVQLPWARAYLTARNVPNTLVYPTTRTPDREADFRWLGPMGPTLPGAAWVWRMKDREVNAASYRDLNRYHVGVVVGDSPVRELGLRGVSKDALDFANSNDINVRKFVSGRVDAIIDTDLGMAWQLKQQSRVPGDAVHLLPYSNGSPAYFAANRYTPAAMTDQLQAAIHTVIRRGDIKVITRRYLPDAR